MDAKNQEFGIQANVNANAQTKTVLQIGFLIPNVNVSNNIALLLLFHALKDLAGILINVNAFQLKNVLLQLQVVLKAKDGIPKVVNVNAFRIFLAAQIPRHGMMISVGVNALLQNKAAKKERSGIITHASANALVQVLIVTSQKFGIVNSASANVFAQLEVVL